MKAITSLLSQLWQNSIFKLVLIILLFALIAFIFVLVRKAIEKNKASKKPVNGAESKFQLVDDIMAMGSDHIIE